MAVAKMSERARAAVRDAVVLGLCSVTTVDRLAVERLVSAIDAGKIPNVSINY